MPKPHAIIIGAGFTGCAIAHDLTLRGFEVTTLDRGNLAVGTSGRTHGVLHSGGRYCVNDIEAAKECIQENIILRKIASQCIEYNQGFFIALNEEDMAYAPKFLAGAQSCGIPVEEISTTKALQMEPNLNPGLLAAYQVPDGSFDPLRLALAFAASAKANGAKFYEYHEVTGIINNGQNRISGVRAINRHTREEVTFSGDIVINAAGAWAGRIAKMAGAEVPVIPTAGVIVAFNQRLTQHLINRLNYPGDGDILIPQRRMGVIGTTSFTVEDPDYVPVEAIQVEEMIESAIELVPAIQYAEGRGTFVSTRPLIGSTSQGRSLSRTFKCYDHLEDANLEGFMTISGGKATTCRIMAEKASDLACSKLGINVPCTTQDLILESYRNYYRS